MHNAKKAVNCNVFCYVLTKAIGVFNKQIQSYCLNRTVVQCQGALVNSTNLRQYSCYLEDKQAKTGVVNTSFLYFIKILGYCLIVCS